MDEQAYSSWCVLPRDILWLIIQLTDFIGFHSISAVCKNWKLACKSYCTVCGYPPLPNDPLPWLITKKSLPRVEIYRPLTNKTYKVDLPDLEDLYFLFCKDGWLLLRNKYGCHNKYVLLNPFSMVKIDLPKLGISLESTVDCGTFSTLSKCPDCVIVVGYNGTHSAYLYAWKNGSNAWNTRKFIPGAVYTAWLCDDQFYCFSSDRITVFDKDLNLKKSKSYTTFIDLTWRMSVCENEVFAISTFNHDLRVSDVCKFDPSTMDWSKVDAASMISFDGFNYYFGYNAAVQSKKAFFVNNLKNYGCTTFMRGKIVIIFADPCQQFWVNF